jgi:hypothetical protein
VASGPETGSQGRGASSGAAGDGDGRGLDGDGCAADAPPSHFGEGGLSSRPLSTVAYPYMVMAPTVWIRSRRVIVVISL